MIGLGSWEASVSTIFFKGDVKFTITDKNGEYDIDVQLPGDFSEAKLEFFDIEENGNTLSGNGKISLLPGKKITAKITFDGDTMTGGLKIPFLGEIKLKNGKKVSD